MRYITILLVISLSIGCSNKNDEISNEYIEMAKDYGVIDKIDFAGNLDEIERDDWIEFLETVVEMKKNEERFKLEYKRQQEIAETFNAELASAKSKEAELKIWQEYGKKYDWILPAENAVLEN